MKQLKINTENNVHFNDNQELFNKNENDISCLKIWKIKSKKSNFYKTAINVQTKIDCLKRKMAKKNLNKKFFEFWNLHEIETWCSNFLV